MGTRLRIITLLAVLAMSSTFAMAQEAYLGLSVRDSERGAVVSWISPGPLGGSGFDSTSGIRRSDLLVSVGGKAIKTADELDKHLESVRPGQSVRIVIRRAPDAAHSGAVPDAGNVDHPDTTTIEVTAVMGDRSYWTGTIGRASEPGAFTIETPGEGEFEAKILETAASLGLREADGGLDTLTAYLAQRKQSDLDPNSLPAIVQAFMHPLRLDSIAKPIADRARAASRGGLDEITALIAHVLNINPGEQDESELRALDPWSPIVADLPFGYIQDAQRLVEQMRRSVYIYDDRAESHIQVIRKSPEIVQAALERSLQAMPVWHHWVQQQGAQHADGQPLVRDSLPTIVQLAVTGDVMHYELDDRGRIVLVVGGSGANEYDMSRIACVYDLGGDNVYRFDRGGPHIQVIIDLAGNDRYEAVADFAGPGTGIFGFSIVDDRGGNDVYRSERQFSLGAGLFGIGVILDHGGNDRYDNTGPNAAWSTGIGFYGAGLVISRGGHDVFLGEQLVQGVGGPRGFGAIINAAGNDLYRANGPHVSSLYGTPAVFGTMGQGFGYGIRGYAAGGIGAIYELGGSDRYEAGEFAQAGGYYYGMGIMHDFSGDDLYYGNRYGQAFAAHQAIGLLIDDGGNDTFWSMTAASQSGAWDESITMLICRGGQNAFRCDGLGQGAAAHQSIALLIATDGTNHYVGRGNNVQGQSSSNEYRYANSGAFSFSGFFDLGGKSVFSSGRSGVQATGARHDADPARSQLHGLFADH